MEPATSWKPDGTKKFGTNQNVNVTSGGKEYLSNASELIISCFWEDPVLRYMMCNMDDESRKAYFPAYIRSLLKAASLNDAVFQEADDWSCTACWMPPGKRVDNYFTIVQAGLLTMILRLGLGGLKRMLGDFQSQSNACKRRFLRDGEGNPVKRYHYLFFLATDPKARGKGLASEVAARHQQKAAADGLPIWLEATTKHSRDVYKRLGFEELHEMKLGKGTHAASGVVEMDGPGVSVFAMIWWPPSEKV